MPIMIRFRRPDRYSSLAACALSLTLSHGRGNSVAVVFSVVRFCRCVFLPLRCLGRRLFSRQSYRFSRLAPSPCGGGLGRGRQTAGLLHRVFRHHHFQTA
ncbi:hypothetical protein LVJ83_05460 [Uruburuella testudinis]|uniref:Secreted protein n=1 Tax=Uruburuella testudinis TaxID=1282863 RepID=A0ABY4DV42_9NEIS|nr:hypothetical protein [Uruburuella testudinis]UOO82910.1 hypothetical protein LVJ83_05460 [Uruburuella testudinis]